MTVAYLYFAFTDRVRCKRIVAKIIWKKFYFNFTNNFLILGLANDIQCILRHPYLVTMNQTSSCMLALHDRITTLSFYNWLVQIYLKVWSTVKIRRTRVPQNAIVPVGWPRSYSIIILNMRFIPKASLRASFRITAQSWYILERHLWVNNSKPWPLLSRWLANKLTVLLWGCRNWLTPSLYWHPVNTKHLYDFIQCWANVEDVWPTLYKCYRNMLCLLGRRTFSQTLYISLMLVQCWPSIADVGLTLKQHWVSVSLK